MTELVDHSVVSKPSDPSTSELVKSEYLLYFGNIDSIRSFVVPTTRDLVTGSTSKWRISESSSFSLVTARL